jgi:predicted HicB family RNase H-like nuclease
MSDTSRYRVGPDAEIDDVDLGEEEVYFNGERLTEERAEELARATLVEARRRNLIPGGKSLSGGGKHSPTLQFRVPQHLRDELERRAAAEGVSISKLARRALEQYLEAS